MNWMELMQAARTQAQQHKSWQVYWDCVHRIEAGKRAFADNAQDPMGKAAWEKYGPDAGILIAEQQHKEIERLAETGETWSPPEDIDFDGEKIPLKLLLLIPYAQSMCDTKEKSARRAVLLIDENRSLTPGNREVLRRALFDLCEITLVDEVPLPPDVELFRTLRDREAEGRRALRSHFDEQPFESHVPKSQRQDFAQTRGPRPQHNAHFSKQAQRGRGTMMHRGRGRGR